MKIIKKTVQIETLGSDVRSAPDISYRAQLLDEDVPPIIVSFVQRDARATYSREELVRLSNLLLSLGRDIREQIAVRIEESTPTPSGVGEYHTCTNNSVQAKKAELQAAHAFDTEGNADSEEDPMDKMCAIIAESEETHMHGGPEVDDDDAAAADPPFEIL